MSGWLEGALTGLGGAPSWVVYAVLGAMAALENVVPPVPADVVVVFGALLAARGAARPELVFAWVWFGNVTGALLVYAAGRRYGPGFFEGRPGRFLLRPGQLAALSAFYRRYGVGVILVSRFLPMFRAVVPVFAGVAGVGWVRAALPIALASAAWYGLLVYLGAMAGRNWDQLMALLAGTGRWLWLVALLAVLAVARWWWRSRRADADGGQRDDRPA